MTTRPAPTSASSATATVSMQYVLHVRVTTRVQSEETKCQRQAARSLQHLKS
ncbi:hypothetical protein [Oryza sativa Japonica Group]|uniref:Uncharacterized protein n=2 Tax=Oryza sativa subsp. japonica TaxID=39947 RepID=Q5VPN5_ORYSJ|nr:hypothetical protein [Oryza sativa Japonica Group]BAD68957.1 hypothetical protein [Oryza sativa Japonica Group]